jgi:hypothetical protein
MYKDRGELEASVAVDFEHAAALAPLLDGVGSVVECVAVCVRQAVAAVRPMATGEMLSDAELAGVGAALADVRVRDLLFTTADSDASAAAEALWALLARTLPSPLRAEALTLLAFSAFPAKSAVTGRWPGSPWRRRWPRTRITGWPGCSTPRYRAVSGPMRSAGCCRESRRR